VEETSGLWAIYFDRDDNGLQSKSPEGKRVLEVELTHVEKRWKKDPAARQQEQTTMHAENETEEDPPNKSDGSVNTDGQQASHPDEIALPTSPASNAPSPGCTTEDANHKHAGSTPSREPNVADEGKGSGVAPDLTERFQC